MTTPSELPPVKTANGSRKFLDFERGMIAVILGLLALTTYSHDSHSRDAKPDTPAATAKQLRGTLQISESSITAVDGGRIAIAITPLNLKKLPLDTFDDGSEDAPLAGPTVRRR